MANLTFGEALRRIRKRMGKNTTEFAELIGSTSASVSRYENGKLLPGIPVAMVIRGFAETEDEKRPIDAFILGKNPSQARMEAVIDPVSSVREASESDPMTFARFLGVTREQLASFEEGRSKPGREIIERLKTAAVKAGRADLAVVLSSEDWHIRTTVYPGERFIGPNKTPATQSDRWHKMLDEVLNSGNQPAIEAVQSNLVVFCDYVKKPPTAKGA